jgi:type I restriction enzyme R subunit
MNTLSESVVEQAALAWLQTLGYTVLLGPTIAAGEPAAERSDPNYRDVVLEGRLRQALVRLNAGLPADALEDARRKLGKIDLPSFIDRNRAVHELLVDGITVVHQ